MLHTQVMRRVVPSVSSLLWVVVFALLIVRTADAHMHLCFDGQEPRSSLHVLDRMSGCHKTDGSHQDQDVDALGAAAAKKSAEAEPLLGPPPFANVILLLLPPPRGMAYEPSIQNPSPKLPELFLPPLRGPPV